MRDFQVGGASCEDWRGLESTFRKNFTGGWEKAGASFAVWFDGKLVADLYAGYADVAHKKPWREETISTIFSVTKSLTAICFAILVDRGLCEYSDLVIKYWPEYGKNGKEGTTIDHVLAHQAGLPYFSFEMTLEILVDNEKLSELIENETPVYVPGTKSSYHPFTFGWITDQIFRRINPDKLTVGEFFRREIAQKYDLDLHIGNCTEHEHRVARLKALDQGLKVKEVLADPSILIIAKAYYHPRGYFVAARRNMKKFGKDFTMFNNNDLRKNGQPAVNGIGNARALATLFGIVLENKIISEEMLKKIKSPTREALFDHSTGEMSFKRFGFAYDKSPHHTWQFGHSGVGGQMVRCDPEKRLVIAYITNGMKTAGSGHHVITFNRLMNKTYGILSNLNK